MKALPLVVSCYLALTGPLFAARIIPTHAIADLVLGQPNFTTVQPLAPYTSFKLQEPRAVVVDPVSRKVFVADTFGDRVLRYPSVGSLENGAAAEAVFGSTFFSDDFGSSGPAGLDDPTSLFLDRFGRLWVADTMNNRIVVYNDAASRRSGPDADMFFGQPNLRTITPGTTGNKMSRPTGIWIDANDNLWVADSGNNRVMFFDAYRAQISAAAPNFVLGQPDYLTSTLRSGPSGLQSPRSVTVSAAGTLFVACATGNRVLRFNRAAELSNNSPATAVLGQADFTTRTSGLSASKLNFPLGVFITADDTLWVTDTRNHRLLRFSNASTRRSGSAANGVVGQPDFTTATPGTDRRSLTNPFNSAFVDFRGKLWVPDAVNNRVLRFPPDQTRPLLAVTTQVPMTTQNRRLIVRGVASDQFGISKVQFRIRNGPLKTATGTTQWRIDVKLVAGRNKITVIAVDSAGNKRSRTFNVRRVIAPTNALRPLPLANE